jgi:hypothetical protein
MRYLLIILLLVSGVASAQLPAGQYLKVKEDGTGFELVTVPFATGTRLRDSMALTWQKMADSSVMLRSLIESKAASNHTHTGVYQPAGSYLVAADITGKQTGGAVYLTSNFTTTNITATNTNLTFAIAANEKFIVDIEGTCSKAISTTGLKFAIAAPAGCTISGVQYGGGATLVAPVPSVISAINTLGATLATGIGVTVPFRIHVTVINSSTAGNITLQCASVTSNTATVYAGASMVYYKATGL